MFLMEQCYLHLTWYFLILISFRLKTIFWAHFQALMMIMTAMMMMTMMVMMMMMIKIRAIMLIMKMMKIMKMMNRAITDEDK